MVVELRFMARHSEPWDEVSALFSRRLRCDAATKSCRRSDLSVLCKKLHLWSERFPVFPKMTAAGP